MLNQLTMQGQFKSIPLESDKSLVNNVRYVHNNPVAAGMVQNVEGYQWSSYNAYIRKDCTDEMTMVKAIIGKTDHQFKKFHVMKDRGIYLEIKEDQEALQEADAQRVVSDVCRKYGITDSSGIHKNREIISEIIHVVVKESQFSGRRTARFLGLSVGKVNRIIHYVCK